MTMIRARLLPLLLVAAVLGCDGNSYQAPKTPHGGAVMPLPEKQGAVEFVRRSVEGSGDQVVLVAYFFGADDKPMASPPTSATFTPSLRGAKPVEFKPSGDGEATLTSAPFPAEEEIEGKFSATIGGRPVVIAIQIR